MPAITLSGWGQPHDALSSLLPSAIAIDYARHASVQAALLDIAAHEKTPSLAIGWSLGGQLLVRAIAAGLLRPRALVLIAAPFQFVATRERNIGMPVDLYEKFRDNYERNPAQTLRKAWELICKGDTREASVRAQLQSHDNKTVLEKNWLQWLDMLEGFSCDGLHLADFPPTLLIHGDADAVVYPNQSQVFLQTIPHAKRLILPGCGHAPHWHDAQGVAQAIAAHAHG